MTTEYTGQLTNDDYLNVEFYELSIQQLDTQRQKITRRGRLTAEEDRRLDEIDSEIEHYYTLIDNIYDKLEAKQIEMGK